MARTKSKPAYQEMQLYLDHRLGKGWSAPFVGSTWRVFCGWIHLCDAWYGADGRERPLIEQAMRCLLNVFQPSELSAAKSAIGGAGHEQAEEDLWNRLRVNLPPAQAGPSPSSSSAGPVLAGEVAGQGR